MIKYFFSFLLNYEKLILKIIKYTFGIEQNSKINIAKPGNP